MPKLDRSVSAFFTAKLTHFVSTDDNDVDDDVSEQRPLWLLASALTSQAKTPL
jgi:hypothetical protein